MKYRAIQSKVPESESLSAVTHLAERVYWRMLSCTDSWGRLPGSAAKVKAVALPIVDTQLADVELALRELEQVGRIIRYQGADDRGVSTTICQIIDFDVNQPPEFLRRRSKESAFTSPPARTKPPDLQDTPGLVRTSPEQSEQLRAKSGELDKVKRRKKKELTVPNGTVSTTPPATPPSWPTDPPNAAPPSPNGTDAQAIRRIYDHWRTARSKTDRRYDQISPARRRKLKARLREFTEAELHRGLDAVALDTWEDRPRHDDIIKLFDSREKVDKWLELADKAGRTSIDRLRERIAQKEDTT